MKYGRVVCIVYLLQISFASPAAVDWVVKILGATIYAVHGGMLGIVAAGTPDYGYYCLTKSRAVYNANPWNSDEVNLYKDNYTMMILYGAVAGAAWGVWNSLSEETRTSMATTSDAFIHDPLGAAKTSIQAAIKVYKIKEDL